MTWDPETHTSMHTAPLDRPQQVSTPPLLSPPVSPKPDVAAASSAAAAVAHSLRGIISSGIRSASNSGERQGATSTFLACAAAAVSPSHTLYSLHSHTLSDPIPPVQRRATATASLGTSTAMASRWAPSAVCPQRRRCRQGGWRRAAAQRWLPTPQTRVRPATRAAVWRKLSRLLPARPPAYLWACSSLRSYLAVRLPA